MTWPTRDALCLDCRTTVAAGAACPAGPSHRVRALTAPRAREELLQTVWGPLSLRQRMRVVARDGATGAGVGGVLEGLAECGVESGAKIGFGVILAVILCAIGFIALAWAVRKIAAWVRRYRHTLDPRGATSAPAGVSARAGRKGEARGKWAEAPLSSRFCLGYEVRLVHGRRAVMLRDAATVGFDVALDDGTRVRIPPGPLIVERGRGAEVDLSEPDVDRYLRALDPRRASADDLDPFPYDRVEEALILPGDRVEVLGPLRPIADRAAPAAGYREAAATILVPAGPTQLRLLDPER